ncbi:MAG TPA: EAL domain-containing protein [Acidiferrobacter sp.]|nr:EAL domain-containing protein [Acidiferrobacter sp.]
MTGRSSLRTRLRRFMGRGLSVADRAVSLPTLVRHVDAPIVSITERGVINLFNPAAERLWDYEAHEVLGNKLTLIIPNFSNASLTAPTSGPVPQRIHGTTDGRPLYARRRNASCFAIDLHLAEFLLHGQRQSLITVHDLSHEQELRSRIARLTKLYQASSTLSRATRNSEDEQTLLAMICRIAVDLGGVTMAWIGTAHGDEGLIQPFVSYGSGLEYLSGHIVSRRPDVPEGQGPAGIAFRENRAVAINDFAATDALRPWHASAGYYGFQSMGSFPIPRAGKAFAVLSVYHTERDIFDKEMMDILEDIANNTAYALDAMDRERQRQQAQRDLAHSEQHFRAYFERAMIGMAATSPTGIWLEVNDFFCAMLGYSRSELLQRSWADIAHPDDVSHSTTTLDKFQSGELHESTFEQTYVHKTGRPVYVQVAVRAVHHTDHRLDYIVLLAEDITSRKQREDALDRVARILDESSNEIYMFDADTLYFLYANAAAQHNLGYSFEELQHQTPLDLSSRYSPEHFLELLAPLRSGTAEFITLEGEHRRKNGSLYPIEARLHLSAYGGSPVFVAITQDVTERRQFETKLHHQTTHDALTGLPNRALFHEILDRAMTRATRNSTLLAILFLDLDEFKNVNDALGHEYGDLLLQEVAKRLTAALRQEDWIAQNDGLLARQGGDEFTILLQNMASVHMITRVAERLLTTIAQPFETHGHEMYVTASIGITVYPFDDIGHEDLLRNADVAMYRAKRAGKNTFRFYAASMSTQISEHHAIENGLRHALDSGQFLLHYQPQVDLRSGRLVGVEALIRWQHPERGLISPGLFIPVAEESGLIVPIGEWVLRTACEQQQAWKRAGLPATRMAVNLSGRQFRQRDLPSMVASVLKETGLDANPEQLELELTESMLMEDMEKTAATIQVLHDKGVRLAIDDFGTGYSSLSYLKRFRINTLKIDQSFVRDITSNPDDAAIATAIIGLGHSLGLSVIAEGAETEEQVAFLRNAQCDELQGYYYSEPLPADAMAQWLSKDHRLA